jgi:hypothetical protein
MADHTTNTSPSPGASAPPSDAESEAIVDAAKTFKITALGAVLFCLAALFIIMSTRMG